MKQIGIYGGSFDPIHMGHLNLAVEMLEIHHLDEVWFCPTGSNPHKPSGCKATPAQRLEMVRLAIEGEPRFKILDIEIFQGERCFTVDTLHQLLKKQESEGLFNQYFLIMGGDSAHAFHTWKEPEEIIRCARLLIGQRTIDPTAVSGFKGTPEVIAVLEQGLTPIHVMEVSSTEIRDRLSKKMYCGHLLPGKVLDFIIANQLYY